MTPGPSYAALNRASSERIRALAARLSDEEMQHPVGEHWVVRALHRNEHLDEADAALAS